ncbi:MAG: S-layer homology domain-containing protein [Armatimonadota bacterium]|jgi:predicted porin
MTKKAMFVALIGLTLAVAAPSFAQGPFADVPIDHWAYEAVSQLQDHGIIIGYPDGTFGGKRAMTRYEFAMAISRAIPVIADMVPKVSGATGPSETQIKQWINDAVKGIKIPEGQDLSNLNKLINEFKDELVQIGVDLDALKRDVASLEERVAVLEDYHRKLKISAKVNFFAVGEYADSDNVAGVYDYDGRELSDDNSLLENISFVRDADIIFNYADGNATAKVVLNVGNYLQYLDGTVTSLTSTGRSATSDVDDVSLFLAYGTVPVLGADVTVGRFPIQFTKWTLAKYDVDSYTDNWKTDDGNYYVDGGKAEWTWGSVNILAFAAKNSSNSGMFNYAARPNVAPMGGPFAMAAGGLWYPEQSAGVRLGFDVGKLNVGATYLAVGESRVGGVKYFDQADIWGVDVKIPFGGWELSGAYTQSDSSVDPTAPAGTVKIDDDNKAWEAKLKGAIGGLGVKVGYKRVEPNFSAPGDWARIGRWQNPVNIEGPSVGLTYAFGKVNLMAYGAWYEGIENLGRTNTSALAALPLGADDKLQQYKAGVSIPVGANGSLGFEGEFVKWDPAVGASPAENYYTFSYRQALAQNTRLKLLYQIIDFDGKGRSLPYGANEAKGAVAVAQVSMDF